MRTSFFSLLTISTLSLGIAACGGAVADFEPNGDEANADDEHDAGSGGAGGADGEDIGDEDDDAGAGGGDGGDEDDGGTEPSIPTIPFACPGGTIAPGENAITVDGKERTFFADFPSDTSSPMGVVFAWHGYGDLAANFRSALGLDPNANPSHPLIVVTPEDANLQPIGGQGQGLDWDILAGKPGDDNIDLAFFEAMLGCLNEQHSLDASRVYSLGFSAGSVFTALLHSRYPDLFAATVHFSGAWMNDPEQTKLVPNFVPLEWSWPDLDPADGGHVLLTHGGPGDEVGAMGFTLINLEDAAQAALPFLATANRTVVDCAHDDGHVLHPELTSAMIVNYLTAHRAGAESPYAGGTLEGLPESCTLRLP